MKILGVGLDRIDQKRIHQSQIRFGDRLAKRILSEPEFLLYVSQNRSVRFLANRFAVKEAVAKALRTGIRGVVQWQAISTVNDEWGAPCISLSCALEEFARNKGICNWHVSITDEQQVSMAIVIAEGKC